MDARQMLDQSRHPRQRPQLSLIPMDRRSFQERINQRFSVRCGKL